MKFTVFLLLAVIRLDSQAQKPALDTSVFHKWAYVAGGTISDDGLYVCYNEYDNSRNKSDLVIEAVEGNWSLNQKGASTAKFTADSKFVFFKTTGDSLFELRLGSSDRRFVAKVSTYEIPMDASLLIFKSISEPWQITLHNLTNEKNTIIENVESYIYNSEGSQLLLVTQIDSSQASLSLVSLNDANPKTIFTGAGQQIVSYAFDKSGQNVAFISQKKKDGEWQSALRLYEKAIDSTVLLSDDQTPGIDSTLRLAGEKPEFSSDGRFIFFGLTGKSGVYDAEKTAIPIKIWSYLDTQPEPVAEASKRYPNIYIAAVRVIDKNIIRIEQNNEKIVSRTNDVVVVRYSLGNDGLFENAWNPLSRFCFSLVFLRDGSRKLIKNQLINPEEYLTMSPDGRWLVYFDFDKSNYYSYEVATGTIRNVTSGIPNRWTEINDDHPEPSLPEIPNTKSWLPAEDRILIMDSYDLWLIDPSRKSVPVNITNGYGRRHRLKFRPLDEIDIESSFSSVDQSTLILRAISNSDQTWFFFSKDIRSKGDPTLLSKGSYVYGSWGGHGTYPHPPDRARNSSRYLISRMSAISAPNYFVTNDFRSFTSISDVQPQKKYNWLTTEEIRWKTFDGTYSQGILYKPENFDPRRKYPIIFDYYETRSDELNLFILPKPSADRINIPWYVSQEYLVFVPDIHYKIGQPGVSAYNSVVSAARFLATKPWVDSRHMGLQGHSFGGYETNFLLTHTHLFAAACSASGVCDLISLYGSIERGSYTMYWAERAQGRIGATLWKAKDLYIENSPIFKADKITTPLLMMHGNDDHVVPFSQAVEFFTALRRLSKSVWLIEYNGSGHSINGLRDEEDFTNRMNQFFDHYLKDAPAPGWMTERIN